MNMDRFFSRPLGLALSGLVLLTACAEDDIVLPGVREDIRPEGQAVGHLEIDASDSRPIRLASATTNANWSASFGTSAFRTAHPALRLNPQRIWSTNIGDGDSRRKRITASPVVGGGRIFTLDSGSIVSAVAPSGAVLWSTDILPDRDKDGDATGGGIAYANDTLYVSLGFGDLVAMDATSGGVRWRQRLGGTGSGTPTVSDGIVYLVSGDDTGWAVDADTGRIRWQVDGTPSAANVLGAPAPAVTSKFAVFAFGSGEVVGAFKTGGVQRWTAIISGNREGISVARYGDLTGAPVVVGDTAYIGNQSGRLVALNVNTGSRNWTTLQGTISSVWPAGDSIFAITDTLQLIRVDASDGSIIWSTPLPNFVRDTRRRGEVFAHYGPILAGGRVIVASNDGLLRSFNPENGTLTATTEIPDGASSPLAVADGTLYVVSTKGDLYAFR